MTSKYQPIDDLEKFQDVTPGRTSTSESLGSTLLDEEERGTVEKRPTSSSSRWMWLVQAALLTLSFSMFVGAFYTRASTLTHVKKFSSYCKVYYLIFWDID